MKNQLDRPLVVYTPNPKSYTGSNYRFQNYYDGELGNFDRMCLVGIPNTENKTLSIGISLCSFPDNFSKVQGFATAKWRAEGRLFGTQQLRPYVTIHLEQFTQENCLNFMYEIHAGLIQKSVKEVKKLINNQIVK